MRGKRVRTGRYTAGHLSTKRTRHQRCDAERWAVAKLVLCGVVFVLIVAMKLLFPEAVGNFRRTALQLIGNQADFEEAFAAVGRIAGGEEGVGETLQDAYAAVFSSSSVNGEVGDNLLTDDVTTLREMTSDRGTQTEEEIIEIERISFSALITELPENVDPQQQNLGFDCVVPVCGTISSTFGWRIHPIAGDLRFHYGIDLAADVGTEICAFADGEIFATGESSTLGKYIILSHDDGYRTLYAHCHSVLKFTGEVSVGDVIATVGESGSATGPHLHFEFMKDQKYLDPACYVKLG